MRHRWWAAAGSAPRPWPSACAATTAAGKAAGTGPTDRRTSWSAAGRSTRCGGPRPSSTRREPSRRCWPSRWPGECPRPAAGAPGAARTGRRRAGVAAARPAVVHTRGPAGRGRATARGTGRAAAPAAARLRGGAARAGGRGGGLGPPRSRPDRGPGSPVLRRAAHSSHRFGRTARSSGTQPAAGGRRVPSRRGPDAAGRRAGPAGSGISAACAVPGAGRQQRPPATSIPTGGGPRPGPPQRRRGIRIVAPDEGRPTQGRPTCAAHPPAAAA